MQNVITFLKKLSKNNNRDWFLANKQEYARAKEEVLHLASFVLTKLGKTDPDLKELEPKNCIFRVNRDIRFSHDKSPYKTNMGMWMARGGKKSPFAGYYIHLEPGKSFIAAGSYQPEPPFLKAIRQEIDYNLPEFAKLLKQKKLRETFGTFAMEYQSKTSPKGYSADHPAINFLKLKSFILSRSLTDEELADPLTTKTVAADLAILTPLVHFLNKAIESTEK